MIVNLLSRLPRINGPILLSLLASFGLMSFSCYCGFILLKKDFVNGINLSIFNQLLQIFSFGLFGYSFEYISGILLGVTIDVTKDFIFRFVFRLTTCEISLNSNPEVFYISVNFIAIFILNYLFNVKGFLANKKMESMSEIEKK